MDEGDSFQVSYIKTALKQRLTDISRQELSSQINENSQCTVYRMFKSNQQFELYLQNLDQNDRVNLCKFRCRNHFLPITKNRFKEVDRKDLLCMLCSSQEIGDEFHYLLKCPFFNSFRKDLIGVTTVRNANVFTISKIMNCKKISMQRNLAKFVNIIMNHFADQTPNINLNSDVIVPTRSTTRSGISEVRPNRLDI